VNGHLFLLLLCGLVVELLVGGGGLVVAVPARFT
jgi:hypothetical protein